MGVPKDESQAVGGKYLDFLDRILEDLRRPTPVTFEGELDVVAVTGSPLWNLIPGRRMNSALRPSLDMDHDSARLGAEPDPAMA